MNEGEGAKAMGVNRGGCFVGLMAPAIRTPPAESRAGARSLC